MRDFIAAQDRALLEQHDLASFDTLWALKLEAVDEPNTVRGGWSTVYRLQLGEYDYYLKRQSNYLTLLCCIRSVSRRSLASFATFVAMPT